jgi:pSer/pThr/pTyr-binding forkhead associated (FHA) protein
MTALYDQTDRPDTRLLPRTLDPTTREVPTLEISMPGLPDVEYDLVLDTGFDQVVGRDTSADIAVPDPALSRQHARVTHDLEGVWLEDLGSTNGTYINGHRIADRCRLRDGDRVRIGNTAAIFRDGTGGSDSTEYLPVVLDINGPPDLRARPDTTIGATGDSCARCSAVLDTGTWFCHRCAYQHSPIAIQQAAPGRAHAEIIRQRVTGPHGSIRSWQFRQVMQARNGGRRPLYNESLAIPALVLRLLAVTILVLVAVAAVILLGLGVHHFVQLREQPGAHSIAGHSRSFVPNRFHARMR